MLPILAVIGRSKSGKTTLIEYLISYLSKEKLKIGTIKHVHHSGFSFDVRGKDTWRHSQAGARVVVCVAPEETTIIRKTGPHRMDLEEILDLIRNEDLDLIIVEGLHSLVAVRNDIFKVITAKNEEDLRRTLLDTVSPILTITGPIAEKKGNITGVDIPVINIHSRGETILELVRGIIQNVKK